jgi:hypothetical protein
MKDYTLSKERIAELEEFHRSLRDKRQADRVKASQFMVGGGMYNLKSDTTITNCILWGNTAANGNEIYNNSSTQIINYGDVQGGFVKLRQLFCCARLSFK